MANNTPIERILCATDTSKPSQVAVNQAAALAVHCDAELILLYVSPSAEDERDIPALFAVSREMKRLADDMLRRDHAALDVLVEGARKIGARVRRHLMTGDPADSICRCAEELDAQLIVTGTHGRTGIDKLLLGSVAERVIRVCRRPVLVARNPLLSPSAGFKRVLVPSDFSDHARCAVDFALSVGATDCEIELLHCWRLPAGVGAGPSAVVANIIRSVEREIRARGNALVSEVSRPGATITFHAVRKPPAQGVTERVGEGDFDLIVMGSQGRTGLSHFLMGSVAEATIHHASCSVIVVPPLCEPDDDGADRAASA